MGSGGILVTNERLARLTGLAEDALGSRDFSLAEELYSEKLQMLREFRYVDDLELAKTTNMLAFSQECQNKIEQAAKNRLATLDFCANKKLMTSPMQRPPLAPKLSRQQPSLRQQIRIVRTA